MSWKNKKWMKVGLKWKWNVSILRDVMAMQRRYEKKVINYIRAKAQHEWDKMVIVTKQCLTLPKPTLVKLASKQLLQMLNFNA